MKIVLRLLLLCMIVIAAVITFLLTPTGLRVSVDLATKLLPGEIHYQKVSGVVIGPLTFYGLRYQNSNQTIAIHELRVNWSPLDLLKNKLHITALHAQDLQIITTHDAVTQWDDATIKQLITQLTILFKKNTLPFNLVLDNAAFDHIQLIDKPTHTQMDFQKITLQTHTTQQQWHTTLIAIMQKPNPFQLRFQLHGKPTHYALQFSLTGNHTQFSVIGNGDSHAFTLQTTQSTLLGGSLHATLKTQWNKHRTTAWQGTLNANAIHFAMINPEWDNKISAQIHSIGDHTNSLSTNTDAKIQTRDGQLHFVIQHQNTWHIHWHLQLNALSTFFSQTKGELSSDGKINGDLSNPTFTINVTGKIHAQELEKMKHIKMVLSGNAKQQTLTAFIHFPHKKTNFKITGYIDRKTWHGTLQQLTVLFDDRYLWQLTKPTSLIASSDTMDIHYFCLAAKNTGSICLQAQNVQKKINAQLQLDLHRFDWLRAFTKDITVPGGQLQMNMQMNGTLKKPHLTGDLKFMNGSIFIPAANITLKNITAAIFNKKNLVTIRGQAFSANQPVNLQGSLDLSKPYFSANALLTMNHFLLLNTDQYVAYVTSQLKATIEKNNIFITGAIHIPKGSVRQNDFKTTTTLPADDIVYTGTMVHPPKPFWLIHTNVAVTMDDIHLAAFNADAQLQGNLQLFQEPLQNMFATGDIVVRKGTYSVVGQTLQIAPNSSLSYHHNLIDNPVLNLKASKTIQSVGGIGASNFSERELMVGIEIHGPIRALKITFFSNRGNLSQADILSYILLGYGNDSDTPGNTSFLLRALAAVNISSQGLLGKQNIASQIQSGLGLSEMGVESETSTDTLGNPLNRQSAFVVGKHLTRKLYVRYSIGMIDPVNVFELRYLLDKNWAVQTDSSTLGNGADVLYTFQKN